MRKGDCQTGDILIRLRKRMEEMAMAAKDQRLQEMESKGFYGRAVCRRWNRRWGRVG